MAASNSSDGATALDRERGLDTREVGDVLGVAPITLAQMRLRGQGPRFFRVNSRTIRYRLGDVLDYRDSRTVGKSVQPAVNGVITSVEPLTECPEKLRRPIVGRRSTVDAWVEAGGQAPTPKRGGRP